VRLGAERRDVPESHRARALHLPHVLARLVADNEEPPTGDGSDALERT
jgi:hypothetical protein